VDPRYFSAANIKNRLESYFQMVKQKRAAGMGAMPAGHAAMPPIVAAPPAAAH
jgi:hypothetical protein